MSRNAINKYLSLPTRLVTVGVLDRNPLVKNMSFLLIQGEIQRNIAGKRSITEHNEQL